MTSSPSFGNRVWALHWPRPATILLCGLLGLMAPAAFGLFAGIPEPAIHDEFSYLLGADTFARGRLTNPAPPHPEFFEAPHVLVDPSYTSKYQPGQALVLALGQAVAGHPIWGVWLSCALFSASLCWMLQAWTSRRWALFVTVLVIVTLGTSTYWAQSYWGGMLPACGAALVLGGMRYTLHSPRLLTSVLTAIGVLILANTRLFEGALICVPPALILGRWLLTDGRTSLSAKVVSCVLPITVVLSVGAIAMAAYNSAVTGNWRHSPYRVHSAQYLYRGVFVFDQVRVPQRSVVDRIDKFYSTATPSGTRDLQLALVIPRALVSLVFANTGAAFGFGTSPKLQRQPFRGVLLWLVVLVPVLWNVRHRTFLAAACGVLLIEALVWWHVPQYPVVLSPVVCTVWMIAFVHTHRRNTWAPFFTASMIVSAVGGSLVWWWWSHYAAPVVPFVLAAVAMSMQRLARRSSNHRVPQRLAAAAIVLLLYLATTVTLAYGVGKDRLLASQGALAARSDVLRQLERRGGSHLVFVRYEETYSVHKEWVYNSGDLQAAPVLFAHDRGQRNHDLIAAYPGRSVWVVGVSDRQAELAPYLDADVQLGGGSDAKLTTASQLRQQR